MGYAVKVTRVLASSLTPLSSPVLPNIIFPSASLPQPTSFSIMSLYGRNDTSLKPVLNFQLASSICSTIAILCTLYRLYVRRSKFWLAEGLALCASLALLVQVAGVFAPLSPLTGVVKYYIKMASFYAITWLSRLSILFAIIRIDRCKPRRKFLHVAAFIFLAAGGFLIGQLFWICHHDQQWKTMNMPQCPLKPQVAITQLAFNLAADFLLLIVPLHSLVVLQDHWLRTRLMVIFSTCMITTVVSVLHAMFIMTSDGPEVVIIALVESSVALIICNVPVIATSVFDLSATSAARSATDLSETQPRFTVHFHSASVPSTVTNTSQVPSSTLSMPSARSISQPYTLRHGVEIRNLNSRPSSALLKPEDALSIPNPARLARSRLSSP